MYTMEYGPSMDVPGKDDPLKKKQEGGYRNLRGLSRWKMPRKDPSDTFNSPWGSFQAVFPWVIIDGS